MPFLLGCFSESPSLGTACLHMVNGVETSVHQHNNSQPPVQALDPRQQTRVYQPPTGNSRQVAKAVARRSYAAPRGVRHEPRVHSRLLATCGALTPVQPTPGAADQPPWSSSRAQSARRSEWLSSIPQGFFALQMTCGCHLAYALTT